MMDASSRLADRAAELRSAFDRGFTAPLRVDTAAKQGLLAIRVGAEPYVVRLSEISGLFAEKTITRVPGGAAALLGIAGFRGAIVPVYGLRTLLGHAGTQTPRWLVIAASAQVALAFEAFEGQLRVASDAVRHRQSGTEMPSSAREFVRTRDAVHPVLHLPSVLDAIAKAEKHEIASNEE
jgi:purine-binding chemotaxis protein CheW